MTGCYAAPSTVATPMSTSASSRRPLGARRGGSPPIKEGSFDGVNAAAPRDERTFDPPRHPPGPGSLAPRANGAIAEERGQLLPHALPGGRATPAMPARSNKAADDPSRPPPAFFSNSQSNSRDYFSITRVDSLSST